MRSLLAAAVVTSVVLLGGCSGGGELPPAFVGHVAPRSGPDRRAGEAAERGIRLAVQEANQDVEKGAGRQVKVIHADTLSNPKALEAEGVRLVSVNRVVGLIGGTNLDEAEQLERARVPVVTASGQRTRTQSEAIFYTGLAPEFAGKVLARFAADDLKATQVAVLTDESRDDALALADAFVRELAAKQKKEKTERVLPIRFGKSLTVEAAADSLESSPPALLLFAGKADDLRTLRKRLGKKVPTVLFGGPDGSAADLLPLRGASSGVYLVTAFHPDADPPRVKEFVEKYAKTFGEAPDVHAALAYDNARLVFEGMRQAKEQLSPLKLREKLAAVKEFPGLTGPLTFGDDRQARRPAFVVQLDDGQAKLIKKSPADE